MAPRRDIVVRVEVDAQTAHIIGRNGLFELKEIEIRSSGRCATISGIGRPGKPIDGGIRLTMEAMDRLAHRWLRERVRR